MGAIERSNETEAVGPSARDFSHDFGAPGSAAIRPMEGCIDATFIKVDKAFRLEGLQFVLKPAACELVALAVPQRFFRGGSKY